MKRSRDEFTGFAAADATRLLRIAYLLTGDRTAAEDLLQDVLERTYVAWPRIDNPFAYARTVLARQAANRWRSRARRPQVPLEEADHPVQPDPAARADDRDQLMRALADLPTRQRAAVVLRYLEELSEVETAAVLRCSVGNVKSQTSRGLAKLRSVLDSADGTTSFAQINSTRSAR
jgi:RNA polymerase sigma-70 factor (sigma-E family)